MFFSAGVEQFAQGGANDVAEKLTSELLVAPDAVVASWLRFYLAYSQMQAADFGAAYQTLQALLRSSRNTPFHAAAYLALAKWSFWQGDISTGIRAYQQLLTIYPDYKVKLAQDECCDASVTWNNDIGSGHRSIRVRVNVNRRLAIAKAATSRAVSDTHTSAIVLAKLWYRQGEAVEVKLRDDPNHATDGPQDVSEQRECFQAAVSAAPGSDPAGRAAWRLIDLSQPYEWEGNWQEIIKWATQNYGAFVASYPRHPLVGEAKFNIAVATWASAGYPELFHYIFPVRGFEDFEAHRKLLEKWFDTRGFGGGGGELIAQNPEAAAKAIPLFEEMIQSYPKSASAGLAAYYIGVIYDQLNDPAHAGTAYRRFVAAYPTHVYVGRARKRMASFASHGK